MTVDIRGYSHVNLLVDDLDAARTFYTEVLGFEELERPAVSGQGAWFRVGNLQLHLSVVGTMPPTPAEGAPHIALHVPTSSFEDTVRSLDEAGAPMRRGASSRIDLGQEVWTAFVTDPAGNLIELTDVGPLD